MASFPDGPIQLLPIFRERVWGRDSLAPLLPITPKDERIGEAWFTSSDNLTSLNRTLGELISDCPQLLGTGANVAYRGMCPLLLKLLFTSDRLSVQVHPDDAYADKHHKSLGKTEAWYVLAVEPPGEIALGFREKLSRERVCEAARSGEIEQLIDWRAVSAGDVFYVPAGTVHAIGAGVTVCEIQENSDLTYRLYDFERGRELHLDRALDVARLEPYDYQSTPAAIAPGRDALLDCRYFRLERLRPEKGLQIDRELPYYLLLVCISGTGEIGKQRFAAGQTWLIPAHGEEVHIEGPSSEWLLVYTAEHAATGIHANSD